MCVYIHTYIDPASIHVCFHPCVSPSLVCACIRTCMRVIPI